MSVCPSVKGGLPDWWAARKIHVAMRTLRAVISAITLLAVTVNPVAAAFVQCCCAKPIDSQRACCQTAAKKTAAKHRPCCAKRQKPAGLELRAGCCCVKPTPASALTRIGVSKLPEKPSLDVLYLPEDIAVRGADGLDLQKATGRFAPAGPPLLALYCVWLK